VRARNTSFFLLLLLFFFSSALTTTFLLIEGIPMLFQISPLTEESFRSLTESLLERFDSSESYGLVLRLAHSWKFAMRAFPSHAKDHSDLFLLLIRKGSWQDARLIYDVFTGEIAKDEYRNVVDAVMTEIGKGASAWSALLSLSPLRSLQGRSP
jgi:hypothetical protein